VIKKMANYRYKYLIIGGGMTADAAARSIREDDPDGTIGLIGSEKHPPYARPPLSKSLWKGEEELDDIYLGTEEVDLELHLGRIVKKIDPSRKIVIDDDENAYNYTKLLIATGGSPRKLPKVEEKGIIYYRTLSDYKKLKELVDKNKSFGVIGGGFIGSEIAAAIKTYKPDAEVSIMFPENGICALIFPENLSKFINDYYRDNDIQVLTGELVENIRKEDKRYIVKTKRGKEFKFDVIIAGLGIKPNVEVAQSANLKIGDGIIVNEYLQTSDLDIYAAGDVAMYHNPALDKFIRLEHEDNAYTMGEVVGHNMAGKKIPFDHLSLFYSDLFELGYEAVGILNPKLDIIEDWREKFEEGVIYYLEKGRVKGVLLWNVWDKVDDARKLITESGPFSPEDLKDRIKG
jgi:3-phenylpropionate/trans-cinnamate dioxygenase ferredoxin reductase subunit